MENKKTKKILIATGVFPPSIGGPATYSKLLLDELPHYGLKPEVLSFDSVMLFPWGIRHLIFFWKLYRKSANTDLVYALDPVSVGLPASLAAMLRGKFFYLRVAGDYAWEQACQRYGVTDLLDIFLDKTSYPRGVKWLRRIEWSVARHADRIIVPSKYLKNVVKKWGIAEEKVSVIGNAPEGEMPEEKKEVLRGELALRKKTVITAGRLVPWKGFATLIEGLAPYLKEKDIELLLAGSGPDESKLKALVEKNDLSDNVTFLGALRRRDLLRYVKASDVFVLNTAYEGFSHQILEAMILGTPVVSTAIGGNQELIEDGEHGFLVPLNDIDAFKEKIDKLLFDDSVNQQISFHARERASIFTKKRAVENFISLLP
ncbi:MAG: glycosyltransferase family 4 protein [Candidatus Paceibacterota bacterium]|jgi:glycosyltransferase involved in cell wall biosynthesis